MNGGDEEPAKHISFIGSHRRFWCSAKISCCAGHVSLPFVLERRVERGSRNWVASWFDAAVAGGGYISVLAVGHRSVP
jgi:hypothetical protein